MDSQDSEKREQEIRELYDFVAEQVLAGLYKSEIIEKVIELGVDRITASGLVSEIDRRMQNIRKRAILLLGVNEGRQSFIKELDLCGYELFHSQEEESILPLLKEAVPDLIIIDHLFSGEKGHDVLKSIRSDPIGRRVPVFVLSERKLMKEAFLNHGLVEFFGPPVSEDEVLLKVQRILIRPKGI